MRYIYFIVIFFMCFGLQSQTEQEDEEKFIQFSGITVHNTDFSPIPYVVVYEKHSRRGTTSDYYGFFSFVAQPGDTVVFKSIGYKKSTYIIPDTLTESNYSMIHQMSEDTILLNVQKVYPWPSREQFKEAFVAMEIPNDDLKRAEKNLDPKLLALKSDAYEINSGASFKAAMQNYQTRLYFNGQSPPNNLLNPLAWARFIQAWRNGDFKKDRNKKDKNLRDY